jgi:hypothetical protein
MPICAVSESIQDSSSRTLADLRARIERCPEAFFSEPAALARRLSLPEIEVEAAIAGVIEDGLEIRA